MHGVQMEGRTVMELWLGAVLAVGGGIVGYIAGATRSHIENQRYLDQLDRWIDKQSRRQHGR